MSTDQTRIEELIEHAAARLSDALDEAAADALVAVERYGAKLQTFCKEAADRAGLPDAWNAMRNRAQKMQKARSEDGSKRARDRYTTDHLKYGLKNAPSSAKAAAIVEALEHDPDVFQDKAVINAAVMAVAATMTPKHHEPSEGTKAIGKVHDQIAFLAYLTSTNVNLKRAEEAYAEVELTELQQQAAGQQLDYAAESVARLIHLVGSYELANERN